MGERIDAADLLGCETAERLRVLRGVRYGERCGLGVVNLELPGVSAADLFETTEIRQLAPGFDWTLKVEDLEDRLG